MGSSYNTKRIKHANHNYETFLYLLREKDYKFLDWAITTAYYAANHYSKGKLFPHTEVIKGKKQTFNNFDDYFNVRYFGKKYSLHKALIALAYTEMDNSIAGALKRLHDLSDTARYHDYELSNHANKEDLKKSVQSKIDQIRDYCT